MEIFHLKEFEFYSKLEEKWQVIFAAGCIFEEFGALSLGPSNKYYLIGFLSIPKDLGFNQT